MDRSADGDAVADLGRRDGRVRRKGSATPVLAAIMLFSACAGGPIRMASRPGPPRASERPGPWGNTIAVYDPLLYGPERPLAEIIAERHPALHDGKLAEARILVNKAQRRLELWVKRRMIKAYRIQLGWQAHGPKLIQGDQKTPEGSYVICAHQPALYYLSLWLAYPNAKDARRGLDSGLIGPPELRAIEGKLAAGQCPPQDTRLGGGILLHGQQPQQASELAKTSAATSRGRRSDLQPGEVNPAAMREFDDWTDGCVALFNPDMREIYQFVSDGTEVIIVANAAVTKPRKS